MNKNMLIKKKVSTIWCGLILSLIYILPVGCNGIRQLEQVNYNVFLKGRLIILVLALFSLLFSLYLHRVLIYECIIFIILFLTKYLLYHELDFGFLYFMATIFVFDFIKNNYPDFKVLHRLIKICSILFVIQIIVITYFGKTNRFTILSSIGDRNYTAYFLLMFFVYYLYTNKKLCAIPFFMLGLFTYSRLFIIACLAGFIVKTLNCLIPKLHSILTKKVWWYIFFQFGMIIISVLYVYFYKRISPDYVYLTGFKRLLNLFDESNYIRCYANLLALESLTFVSFFIGLKNDSFAGLSLFKGKTIYPHNAVWSLYISYGLVAVYSYIKRFISCFRGHAKRPELFFLFLMYQCILGPSSFYGIDLIILLIILEAILHNGKYAF